MNCHNGSIYIGMIKNNQRNGKGIEYYANGDRYYGKCKDGNENGKGIYYITIVFSSFFFFLVFAVTVIFRPTSLHVCTYNLHINKC